MTQVLLIFYIIFLSYISLYALFFIILGIVPHFKKNKKIYSFSTHKSHSGSVAILIPSYNEREGLVDAVETTLAQDYEGEVDIYILLNNKKNNLLELNALSKFYGTTVDKKDFSEKVIFKKNNRQITIVLTGFQHKKDKINFIVKKLTHNFIAILDADHRPSSNWISSTLAIFMNGGNQNIAAVQTRRRPLSVETISQIVDSHNAHCGNELFNVFLSTSFKSSQSVFFTGTAAVFKTEIFKKFSLADSVTEDTFLSYQLWCAGYDIAYNNLSYSYEEVSPSFRDYVMRRRRWSSGHTHSFFKNFSSIVKSDINLVKKLILFFHGQFYVLPIIILFLVSIYGYYFFFQLGQNLQLAVIIFTATTSFFFSSFFKQKGNYLEWAVAFFLFLPQFSALSIYVYKFMEDESFHYLLSFPYSSYFLWWNTFTIAAPLFVFFSSSLYFKDLRKFKNVIVIPAYCFTIILGLYAEILGFFDMLLGRSHWSQITRKSGYSEDLVDKDLIKNLKTAKSASKFSHKPLVFSGIILITIFIINDLLAVNNCGEIKSFLWRPLFIKQKSNFVLTADIEKKLTKEAALDVKISGEISGNSLGDSVLKYYVNKEIVGIKEFDKGKVYEDLQISLGEYNLGWEKKSVDLIIENNEHRIMCQRNISFSTTLKELKGADLYINNEKFLIKGIIPSFSESKTDISLEEGFKQFKDIGVNTIRLYHNASSNILSLAEENGFLVIGQPDNSTWSEFNISSASQINNFIKRYSKMVTEHTGEPYILFDGMGNEWEFCSDENFSSCIKKVISILETSIKKVPNYPSHYASYAIFIKYPTDVMAINMLDTGSTYWAAPVEALKKLGKPFYASEFGGFTAFYERPTSDLRMKRMRDQWAVLLKEKALGAVFFESHDNWAQPLPTGYNDPFSQDHPDDFRGFWDKNNKPKPELSELRRLLSDLTVETSSTTIDLQNDKILSLDIRNIREYNLKSVKFTFQGVEYFLGDISQGEKKSILVDLKNNLENTVLIQFEYTSHQGLKGSSQFNVHLPVLGEEPIILNDDFSLLSKNKEKISGKLSLSNNLDIIIPKDWSGFYLNDTYYGKKESRMSIKIENPFHAVENLEISRDGVNWSKDFKEGDIGYGKYFLRFVWPDIKAQEKYLVLSGIGSETITITSNNKTTERPTHNYREELFNTNDLNNIKPGNVIVVEINRDNIVYIDKNDVDRFAIPNSLGDSSFNVIFELPKIFAPVDIEIRK